MKLKTLKELFDNELISEDETSIKRLEENDIKDCEDNFLEMLSIDSIIIDKINEIIDYLNKK